MAGCVLGKSAGFRDVIQSLFQFVGLGMGLEVHRATGVLWPLKIPATDFGSQ